MLVALSLLLLHQTPLQSAVQRVTAANVEAALTRKARAKYVGDLDEIRRRGVLRVLTRNNSSHYFVARGSEYGFQYELAKRFAERLQVRLQMVVPESRSELIRALLEGEGDLIAAGMTVSPERKDQVSFTSIVSEARRVVVTHALTVKTLERPEQLPQFQVHINFRSTTYPLALELEKTIGRPLHLYDVPADVEMEEMLRRVGSGEYESTIVDEDLVPLETAFGVELEAHFPIGPPDQKAWAVRPESTQLLKEASAFIQKHKTGGLIRILHQKYFNPSTRFARQAKLTELRADLEGGLSPYDAFFREAGTQQQIDWRLLAALAFTESRFDTRAESGFGAVGLMQMMPATARGWGKLRGDDDQIRRALKRPALNVRLGARYLRWLMDYFAKRGVTRIDEQINLSLAAYNAGIGHVEDARQLAERTGRDPNTWFGNVETALRLKKDRRWHVRTMYGYCQAEQPIDYVRNVRSRFELYARNVSRELAVDEGSVAERGIAQRGTTRGPEAEPPQLDSR